MTENRKKVLLETLRWGVLGFLAFVVAFLLENVAALELPANSEFIFLAVLRFVDRQLHNLGVAERGLTRF